VCVLAKGLDNVKGGMISGSAANEASLMKTALLDDKAGDVDFEGCGVFPDTRGGSALRKPPCC